MSQEYIRILQTISSEKQTIDTPLVEDCEATLIKWTITKANASGAVTRDTTQAYRGEASFLLDTGATTPAINDYANIQKFIGVLSKNLISLSMRFRLPAAPAALTLEIRGSFTYKISGIIYKAVIRYIVVGTDGVIRYLNSAGGYTDIVTITYGIDGNKWYNMEIVFDVSTGKYLYAVFASKQYNLAGATMQAFTADPADNCNVTVSLVTNEAAEKKAFVDDILVSHPV